MTQESREEPSGRADREAADWLARLRAGGSRDQQAFEDWYSADPANAAAYDHVLTSWRAMGGLVDPAAALPRRGGVLRAIAAIAAVVLICVAVAVARRAWQPVTAQSVAMDTATGELRSIALPDGSRVTLDTQSAIRTDLGAERREVRLLRGRARFEATLEKRPFVIETGTASVSAGGSVLDISFFDGRTQVGVVRGTVDLTPSAQGAALVHIAAGKSVSFGQNGAASRALAYPASASRWTEGMLSFENADLATVVASANRYSEVHIVLGDPALASLKFTGTVKARDTIGLARMLAAMFNLRLDASDPRRLVLTR